jgi:uroporphyrinogen decarboxylase
MQHLLLMYRKDPALVHDLARIATDFIKEEISLAISLGADLVSVDGDLAYDSGTFMSPEQFREFIKPYYVEIVDFIHDRGVKVFKHSDGEHWNIMEDFIEIGFDGIHPIQPQCMDIGEVKNKVGERICILGNIDCIDTLVRGSEDDVVEEVRRVIEVAAPGGGYIIASSNTIHPGVKPENYIAMVRAAHRFGVYEGKNPKGV